jgi:hypothetical protein
MRVTPSVAKGTANGLPAKVATLPDATGASATGTMPDDLVFMRSGVVVKVDEK